LASRPRGVAAAHRARLCRGIMRAAPGNIKSSENLGVVRFGVAAKRAGDALRLLGHALAALSWQRKHIFTTAIISNSGSERKTAGACVCHRGDRSPAVADGRHEKTAALTSAVSHLRLALYWRPHRTASRTASVATFAQRSDLVFAQWFHSSVQYLRHPPEHIAPLCRCVRGTALCAASRAGRFYCA